MSLACWQRWRSLSFQEREGEYRVDLGNPRIGAAPLSVPRYAIRTPINAAAWSTPEAYAEVEEIGRAAVWLASDFTDYLVGRPCSSTAG